MRKASIKEFYEDYIIHTIKYRRFLPPIRNADDILWTLRDQIAGRVPCDGPNKMEIVENWTDFLLL